MYRCVQFDCLIESVLILSYLRHLLVSIQSFASQVLKVFDTQETNPHETLLIRISRTIICT